jgi:hypothetical protein
LVETSSGLLKKKGSHSPDALQRHGEAEAEKIVRFGKELFEMDSKDHGIPPNLPKSDPGKVAIAMVLKASTNVGNNRLQTTLKWGTTVL